METEIIVSDSPADLERAAKELIAVCGNRKVIAFFGEMGAGKTTFIKAICKYLSVKNPTSSPSFSLVNEYLTPSDEKVYHFDFYRIKNETEAFDLGFENYLYSANNNRYCFIEWPEKIQNLLPSDYVNVQIGAESNCRVIRIQT